MFRVQVREWKGFDLSCSSRNAQILVLPLLPDNLPAAAAPFLALSDHALVALDGPDAAAFAQAQFANDVIALGDGHWQWNAWLTPKGRVIAVFALLRLAADRILLLLPDAPANELATELQRFVFRRKLKISARDDLHVGGAFSTSNSAKSARIGLRGEVIELDYGDDGAGRTIVIAPSPWAGADEDFERRWFAADLHAGLPRLPVAQREQWTPQQLSLERLQAFSVKKGCYPGQEIVARTHFLGKAKRGIVLFEAGATVETGMEVSDGERAIGSIISAGSGEAPLAMAILPLDRQPAPLLAGGVALHEIALIGGLQR